MRLVRVHGIAPVQQLTRTVAVVKLPAARAHASGSVVGAALRARCHFLQLRDGCGFALVSADLGVLLRADQALRVAMYGVVRGAQFMCVRLFIVITAM